MRGPRKRVSRRVEWLIKTLVAIVLALVAACSSSDDGVTEDTPETRCRRLCVPPKDNPCFNTAATDTTCQSTCLARINGKTVGCQSCLQVHSGWTGETCKCDDAFGGFGSATCKQCRWQSSSNSCSSNVGNSCPPVKGCEGFIMAPVGDPNCAKDCGETPVVDAGGD